MRVVRIKNLQEAADTYCGMEIASGEYYEMQTEAECVRFSNDQKVQDHLSLATPKIAIGDGDKYYSTYLEAKIWLEGNGPRDPDGKEMRHSTPRIIGTYVYFTGAGDDPSNATNYGGTDDHLFCGTHLVNDSVSQSIYRDLNTIANESYIHTGSIQWQGAKNDHLTFEIVPKLTSYTSESNTNFTLYAGFLILPAAGNGNIAVTSPVLVQCTPNEFGVRPAGYWDATWNPSTKVFDNLTPNANGTGGYNIFGAEIVLSRFLNKFLMLGEGIFPLSSNDATQIGHGGRVKITSKTMGTDHEWSWNACVALFRKKTC